MGSQYQPVPRYERTRRTTTGAVKVGSGVLHGWYVNTAVAAGAVTLSDSVGNILDIPVAAAAGSYVTNLDIGWSGTLTATFAGTGDITFLYR